MRDLLVFFRDTKNIVNVDILLHMISCLNVILKKKYHGFQVLLGRATDDIKVDIDLGREKNGGKISRRQVC